MNKNRINVQEICPYTNHVIARFTLERNLNVSPSPQPCTKHHLPNAMINESASEYIERTKPFHLATSIAHRTDFIFEEE